jgi:protein-tyrosine phosphatase
MFAEVEMERVLFVCLGNICRSPLAEGVMRRLVEDRGLAGRIEVDSAGTGAWHVGEAPDPRSIEVADRNGVSLDGQFARKVRPADFKSFTRIVAMDQSNMRDLMAVAPNGAPADLRLLRDTDPLGPGDVPDPYYGGPDGFDNVYQMVERSCRALLDEISG